MLAQFGGMGRRYPGGGYPGGGYPQQTQQQDTPKVFGPTEDLTGTLQSINDSSLVLDEGDDAIVLVQIQKGTKYRSTFADKVKAADFEVGDHVTVEAIRDSDDHYYSKSITMNKKGTAEDKAVEMQASSGHASGGSTSGSPSAVDDDPNRPRLHRANSDSGSTDNSSASSGSSTAGASSASAPASTSVDDDPNRPRLHRSTPDTTSDSASSNTASASPRPAITSGDDSGPPVLHRSSAPSDSSNSNPQIASASEPAARPSLSATDANGVTHLPVDPPASSGAPEAAGTAPRAPYSSEGGDPIIEQARDAAFSFTETLPNYVVKQLTNRYASGGASRGGTSWTPLDIVTTDLVYEDGKERYTNVMVNGKATKYIEQTGSWSEGEFASMLQAILAPQTNADFRNQRPVTIVNRPAYKYDYTIEQPRSTWTLHVDGQTYVPGYTGSIWIDKQTYRVLRIELAARNLPRNFPLDTAESSIDYDFVMISDKKVLLPADSDSLSCVRGTSDCTKNHTEFHNYRKYGSDSSISFGNTEN